MNEEKELEVLESLDAGLITKEEADELMQMIRSQGPGGKVIRQEMHPDIDMSSRAVVKNFATDPRASIAYLKKEHPELEFDTQNDQIIAKKPGEKEWKVLDPQNKWYNPEVADVLVDPLYDMGAGALEGLAAAAAGLKVGLGTFGLGAIPAAMAAGGATGAALEGGRQAVGQEVFGMPENYNLQDVLVSGAVGGAAPLAFGTGAGVKQVGKAALKKGLGQEATEQAAKAQRGLIGRGYDAVAGPTARFIGKYATGESPAVMKKAYEKLPMLREADKAPEVRRDLLKETSQGVKQSLKELTQSTGNELDELRRMIDEPVTMGGELVPYGTDLATEPSIPTDSFLQPFADLIVDLEKTMTGTAGETKDLKKLKKILEDEFMVDGKLPEMMTAAQVDAKRKRFKQLAEGYGLKYGKMGQVTSAAEGASPLDSSIASAFEQSRKNMNDSIVNRLDEMSPGQGELYRERQEYYGYLKNLQKKHKNQFKDAGATSRTLTKSLRDDVVDADLRELQEVTGMDLSDAAQTDEALKLYSKPSGDVRSVGGATSTSKTIPLTVAGTYAGMKTAAGEGDRFIQGLIGGALGSKLGSPAAVRQYMNINKAMREGLPSTPVYAPGTRIPWSLIRDESEQERY